MLGHDTFNSIPAQEHANQPSGIEYPEVHQALATAEE